jgi:uncharacterized membrane protein
MQNPPAAPVPGADNPGAQVATTGADTRKRNRAFYCYLLTWLTGLIFLVVEKDDEDVKYHAAQSLVFFGGAMIVAGILDAIAAVPWLGFVSWISGLIGLFAFIVWIASMYRAWTDGGARFEIPLVKSLVTPAANRLVSLA